MFAATGGPTAASWGASPRTRGPRRMFSPGPFWPGPFSPGPRSGPCRDRAGADVTTRALSRG